MRMRGFLIDRPLRSRGMSMGLSTEQPARSESWPRTPKPLPSQRVRATPAAKPESVRQNRFPIAGLLVDCQHKGTGRREGRFQKQVYHESIEGTIMVERRTE